MKYSLLLVLVFFLLACDQEDSTISPTSEEAALYFPPLNSGVWENTDPEELGWNTSALGDLLNYLEENNTRAFIILKDGKIIIEEYFGENILGTTPFSQNTLWYWASAGKTLTATLAGIAQQEDDLNIENPTSDYLGEGWTSLPSEKEQLIKVKHQLTMSTGLDYNVADLDCTLPSCLQYKVDPSQQWFYHNAPYTLLEKVIESATGIDYNTYTDQKIESLIGMDGQWRKQNYNNVYWSTARDMAKFGLLMLNQGKWNGTEVLSDNQYYDQMVNTSQDLNPSYGYLWWLNGKSSIIPPSVPNSFNVPLADHAPDDLYAGMGKNGQFVEAIPSENLVVVRMGQAPDGSLVPITFHNEMWEKIDLVINP
ncbi:MAG: serine hydrolase domain-containing protein [Bacteroidota bacterium]